MMELGLQAQEGHILAFILSSLRLRAHLPIIALDMSFFTERMLSSYETDGEGHQHPRPVHADQWFSKY